MIDPRLLLLQGVRAVLRLTGNRGWRFVNYFHPALAPPRPVVVKVDGSAMILNLRGRDGWRLFTGSLERGDDWYEDYRCFRDEIHPGDTVVDLGAFVGVWTLTAARLCGPSGRVIAFEPLPIYHRQVAANVVLNGYSYVTVEHSVVGDQDGSVEIPNSIHMVRALAKDGDHGNNGNRTEHAPTKSMLRVPSCRLDTYFTAHDLKQPQLVKMDVEGAEGLVLDGMATLLKGPGAPTLIVEIHPDYLESIGQSAEEILQRLLDLGYKVFHIKGFRGGYRLVPITSIKNFSVPRDRPVPLNRFRVLAKKPSTTGEFSRNAVS
jgi:FkbM family methyltransferase